MQSFKDYTRPCMLHMKNSKPQGKESMKYENMYDFRKRLDEVHKPNRRNVKAEPALDEIAIDASWSICVGRNPQAGILSIAEDLQDYFKVSMGDVLSLTKTKKSRAIVFSIRSKGEKRGYYLQVSENEIRIAGYTGYLFLFSINIHTVFYSGFHGGNHIPDRFIADHHGEFRVELAVPEDVRIKVGRIFAFRVSEFATRLMKFLASLQFRPE